ncbi:packaged DNA stabilization protein [Microcystis phage Mae-Yong1326-1]|nr:packaged DNA stabilization protein [Microcystis phage Mae-Yong1326-1]
MPYIVIEDFSGGLDLRKSAVTARPTSMRTLTNCYVNAGGEIEKRKAFTTWFTAAQMVPGETHGIAGSSGALYTFGAGARPAALNTGVNYMRLNGVGTIVRIRDADVFDGKLYVVAETTGGVLQHFYDGNLVNTAPPSGIVRTYRSRMWAVAGDTLFYSALNNPADWSVSAGGGSINLDTQDVGTLCLRGLEAYYDLLAVMGRRGVQLWSINEDPARNQVIQSLGNAGLVGEKAYARVGDGDVLFLSDSGIRSLRARDSSNAASVIDIGSPLDDLVRAQLTTDPAGVVQGFMPDIQSVVEPETGQFWMAWGSTIYVLSIVPSTRIVAWSTYTLPSPINYITPVGGRLFIRSGDTVTLYGGQNGTAYDSSQAEVTTAMISAGTPATDKMWQSLDIACEGTWAVEVATDPAQPTVFEAVGTITGPTFGIQKIGLQNFGTHIALRLRSTSASRARLGQIILHYETGDQG